MNTIKAVALTLAIIAALWFGAARSLETLDAAPMTHVTPLSTDVEMPQIQGVDRYEPREPNRESRRDLFGYVVEPPPPVIIAAAPVAAPPIAPPPIVEVQPVVEAPPRFDYRYIGRFGPDRNPIAAFAANGEVLTVRRGDRIGAFTLQSIGTESVEVIDEKARVVRVALGAQ